MSLVLLHFLTNIKINKYFNYELRFNGVFSRNNLSIIRVGMYIISLGDKKSKDCKHWVSLFTDRNRAVL